LNEYIHQINRDRHAGNKFKQETQEAIGWQIKSQIIDVFTDQQIARIRNWRG
jgi:hypothetical protein